MRLKILRLMYLSKREKPEGEQLEDIVRSIEEFRLQYLEYFMGYLTKNEEQGSIKEEDFIWDVLFVTLLRTFHRRKETQESSRKLLVEMINFRIDMQTVKLIIR